MRAQLLAAFEESLADTPDQADLLRGIHAGIEWRRRRNRYYRTGIAITAVVIVLVVSMAAASAIPIARDRNPAGIPVGTWRNSIELTWLPTGLTIQTASSTAIGENIVYFGQDRGGLSVFVDNLDRHRTLDEPGWTPTEVNGRPARERLSGNVDAEFSLLLPSGRWADLSWQTFPVSVGRPDLHEDMLRVARGLRESGDQRLRTGFAPSYLSPGLHIIGVETARYAPSGGGAILCATGSLQLTDRVGPAPVDMFGGTARHRLADQGLGVRISVLKLVSTSRVATHRIPDIQGRAAYRALSGQAVLVDDFHGGTLIIEATQDGIPSLTPTDSIQPAPVPFAELIKIAEGVRWIG